MRRIMLLLAAVLGVVVAVGAATTEAAIPAAPPAHPPQPGRAAQPLENGPAAKPAPFLTGPPSARVAIDPHWRANVRANTDTTTFAQQEPSIAVNPLNPLNVVVAQKDERSAPGPNTATKEVWIDTSTDGGLTWPVNVHIPMPDSSLPQQSDPVVNFSDNNNVFITIIGLSDAGGLGTNTVMVARSTDGGLTWPTPAVKLNPGQGGSDKEWTTVDNNPASPFYHRLYTTWTNFAAGPAFIEKWSSDFGVTWNPPGTSYVTVSFGAEDNGQFSMPVVLPNGNVIATWNDFSGRIAVARSTDGGQSFLNPNTIAVNITDANLVPGAGWRLNTIPSTAASPSTGTLVSVWTDGRNGKDDIYFTRSTNGGTSWSAAARVAHNAAGSSYQVEPWVSVAPNGRFDVIWYDDRDFPSNLNTFHIYATHSTDDGATWTGPDEQVTDASTNLNIGIPGGSGWNGAAGDYIGVTSANGVAYGVWTDTRSGTNEDVYTSAYTPPAQGTPTPTATGTPPTATPTRTPTITPTATATPNPCLVQDYVVATATGTIVPGTTNIGSACDDCDTAVTLPFTWQLYGQNYTTVNASSNGRLDFVTINDPGGYTNECLPASPNLGPYDYTIFPYWDDQRTDVGSGVGIFTSVSGTAPNRIFNIEWRTSYFSGGGTANYEVRLYEGQSRFDVVYGTVTQGATSATSGVQGPTPRYTQYFCNGSGGTTTGVVIYTLPTCNTPTITPTGGPQLTPTRTATAPPPTVTATSPAATGTATAQPTTPPTTPPTTAPSATVTAPPPQGTATATSTPCSITFTDVLPTDYFYTPVTYLYCHGVISGYADNTFRPYNNTTRSQMVKIVVLGFQIPITTPAGGNYTFTDVQPGFPFFAVIETAAAHNIVSGYTCGGPGEPCDPQNRPYFRPYANVTRGQLSKIDVTAAGWTLLNPTTQSFEDVFPNTAFYEFVETAVCHGTISGYTCGGPGEPCDPQNRPYFRQNNDATRGQISKIVYLSIVNPPGTCASTPTGR